MFSFETSMAPSAEVELFNFLAQRIGFPNTNFPLYLTGQSPQVRCPVILAGECRPRSWTTTLSSSASAM